MEQTACDITRFLDEDGKLLTFPKKRAARDAILAYLADKFEFGRDYREREVNAILDSWHTFGDFFLLRRELIEAGLLCRERNGSRYWRPAADAPEAP